MVDPVEVPVVADPSTKKPWFSKTILSNLLLAVLAVVSPTAQAWISAHPEYAALGWSALNTVLRLVTKDGISLQD